MHQAVLDMFFTADGKINPALFAHFYHERGLFKLDLSTIRIYPDSAGLGNTAIVIAESTLFDLDPRANLRRLISVANAQHNLVYLLGFKIKVAYLKPDNNKSFAYAGTSLGRLYLISAISRSVLCPVVNETTIALAD